jgi:hypothetical protein
MITLFFSIIGFVLLAEIANISTSFLYLTFLLFGIGVVALAFRSEERRLAIKIYHLLFIAGMIYALMCKVYMDYHNYDHLLVVDSIEVFIPMTEYYLKSGDFFDTIFDIWSEYRFLTRQMPGYYSVLMFFGKLAEVFETDLHLTFQLSTLFFSPFIGIVIFKLFKKNGFDEKESYRNSLIISICSILFFYSSLILRDSHIALLYLFAIYLTFKKEFSFFNLSGIFLISFLTTTFRVESGIFLFILIPLYLFLSLKFSRKKVFVLFVSVLVFIGLMVFGNEKQEEVESVYERNVEIYIEIDKGEGVIGSLSSIPVAGDLFAIIYNFVLPLPFWSRWSSKAEFRNEVYNIMQFPQSISAMFHWFVLFHIFIWLAFKDIRKRTYEYVSRTLFYNLIVGIIFFYLQATVVAQRRLMGYYVMFYILFFIIYKVLTIKEKKQFMFLTFLSFIFLQIFGVYYLGGL